MKEKIFKLLVLPSVANMQEVINIFPFATELTKGRFKKIEIVFLKGKTKIFYDGVDLKKFSFVWLCSSWGERDLAYAIRLYLNENNIPNTYVEKATSKLTDQVMFLSHGISAPNTLFLGNNKVEKYLERIKNVCGYPLVIKDTKGSRGLYSIKISNEKSLLKKMKDLPKNKKYFFQQYIPNNYDWGVMVANGKVVSGEKSYPRRGEFRNNACNGAEEVFVDLKKIPQKIKEMAIQSSRALKLLWSRVDIIIDKNNQKPYVLEVNRMPGITTETSEVQGAYKFIFSQVSLAIKEKVLSYK